LGTAAIPKGSTVNAKIVPLLGKPRIDAWSYSRWSTYEECPSKAYFKFVLKLKEPDGPASARGTEYHKLAEDYLSSRLSALPTELSKLKDYYTALRTAKPVCEVEFALDRAWEPTGWFEKGPAAAWCRIKIDVEVPPQFATAPGAPPTVHIGDHKTGGIDKDTGKLKDKKPEEYAPQFELYAIAGFKRHEIAEQVTTANYFIDAGEVIPGRVFKRTELRDLIELWENRTRRMLADTQYAPNPGRQCRYCHYRKGNGGPCEY
jgi:CRISPR/Cas system-associated exonuclease Cas4 (RecB family)